MQIFTEEFLNLSAYTIGQSLTEKGYFVHNEPAVTDEFIQQIFTDVQLQGPAVNKNGIGYVQRGKQTFLTHMMTVSKAFYEYCTHDKMLEICNTYLTEKNRLKALRYYETEGGHRMQWHTDNKSPQHGMIEVRGLVIICYLTDVEKGQFQLLEGSHEISEQLEQNDFSTKYVAKRLSDMPTINFPGPAGTLIIYDSRCIHRAEPFDDDSYIRKSLFFQVDDHIEDSEHIYLNASYLDNLNEQRSTYLGIGMPSTQLPWPQTQPNDLIQLPIQIID
jgi:hypothetical protein